MAYEGRRQSSHDIHQIHGRGKYTSSMADHIQNQCERHILKGCTLNDTRAARMPVTS